MAGLYIHIPYCHSKCYYCDFFSTPNVVDMKRYVDALCVEFSLRKTEINSCFETIYIGGGTPSILPIELLSRLIGVISEDIEISTLKEFTIEANPEDVTEEWCEMIARLGITRVSMGIQSFDDNELKTINRRHSSQTALMAVETLKANGITEISGDLIYGLPGQTLESWKTSLHELLSMHLPHFSAYLLSYEPGTRLYAMRGKGLVAEATEDMAHEMYNHLIDDARLNGYDHYEISNFSQPGHNAIHNSNYWRDLPYLGLGVSAHSFDGLTRRYNGIKIKEYIYSLSQKCTYYTVEEESDDERHNDYIIVALRTSRGIDLAQYKKRWGENKYNRMMDIASDYINAGKMLLIDGHLSISERSMLISDRIMLDFIV